MRRALATLLVGFVGCSSPEPKPRTPVASVESWMPRGRVLPLPATTAVAEVRVRTPETLRQARRVTLEEVLRRASDHSFAIQRAEARADEARADEGIAKASLLPTISPAAEFARDTGRLQNTAGRIFDVDRQRVDLGGSVELNFRPAEALYGRAAAGERARGAEQGVRQAAHQTYFEAAYRYLALVERSAEYEVAQDAHHLAVERHEMVLAKLDLGATTSADVARAFARLSEADRGVLAANNAVEDAATALCELLQWSPQEVIAPGDELLLMLDLVSETDLDVLTEAARGARPELSQARREVQALGEEHNFARHGWMIPQVELRARLGYLGATLPDITDSQGYVGALRWNLGAALFGRKDKARARLEEAELAEQEMLFRVTREVVQAARRIESSQSQVRAGQHQLDAAQAAQFVAGTAYSQGESLLIEVLEADLGLLEAKGVLIHAIAEYNRAQFLLLWAIGGAKSTND